MVEINRELNIPHFISSKPNGSSLISLLEGLYRNQKKDTIINNSDTPDSFPDQESQRRLEEVESLVKASYWEWDSRKSKSYLSPESCRIMGKPEGWTPRIRELMRLVRKIDSGKLLKLFLKTIRDKKTDISYQCEIQWNGRSIDISVHSRIRYHGSHCRIVAVVQNITMIKDYERALREAVFIDPLTGLANRSLFRDRLKQAMSHADRDKKLVGVLMLDLNDFKRINGSLGHRVGDKLLQKVGCRLADVVPSTNLVARMGGDEFGIILPDLVDDVAPRIVSEKIISRFLRPIIIDNREIFITLGIGISLYPSDGNEIVDLLSFADMAMVNAKERGKSTFQYYSSRLREHSTRRLVLENLLRGAISRKELELYYQPQIDISSGQVKGAEALLRWNSPDLGPINPDEFIEIAEGSGLILGIGRWVLQQGFQTAVKWNEKKKEPVKIAINLSPHQFHAEYDLVAVIREMLQKTGCNPRWIEFEITEGLFFHDFELASKILFTLHHMGFSIALDDFGTGYSAMNRLRRVPVSVIKIDRTFFQGVPACQTASDLVLAMISMATTLHLDIIAEGIENEAQIKLLSSSGCRTAQGYYFSRPVSGNIFEKMFFSVESKYAELTGNKSESKAEIPVRSCRYWATDSCFVRGQSITCHFQHNSN